MGRGVTTPFETHRGLSGVARDEGGGALVVEKGMGKRMDVKKGKGAMRGRGWHG
jgi:hypothetical protein